MMTSPAYHYSVRDTAHGFLSPFLPFHRKFLREFEKALQAVDPDVTLPYWVSRIASFVDVASSVLTL
jgi:hypothetical protein